MEKRALLAAILAAGLLLLYQVLFPPVPSVPPPGEPPAERKEPPAPEVSPPLLPPLPLRAAAVPQRIVAVETPLYSARVGSEGGKLLEWVLRYRGDKPMVVLGALGSRGLSFQRRVGGPETVAFQVNTDHLVLGAARPRGELSLVGQDPYGLRVVETLRFDAQDYRLEVYVKLENRHSVPQTVEVLLPWSSLEKWPAGEPEKFQGQRPTRIVRLVADGVQRVKIGEVTGATTEGKWIGLESEWYIAALIPRSPGFKLVTSRGPNGKAEVALRATPPVLAPGQSWEGRAWIYLGPKEYDRLRAMGIGLEQTIHFGSFPFGSFPYLPSLPMEWLAVPILWLMNFVYRYIPNYGVAIILLTVLTKILLYPLTLKSMAAMKAMQTLQPQINALRAKHQKDPQRLQRETLELYRKHKVNPMGGCLPMVVQIPIFYALYVVFSLSVELQNAKFLCLGRAPLWIPFVGGEDLWICNLATYDPTYVLPVLMGVSMFVQQKMTPAVGDPRQAKMMLLMPVVFTFMFLNLPSGLVLYWFVSNVLQILQQYYIGSTLQSGAEARAKRPER